MSNAKATDRRMLVRLAKKSLAESMRVKKREICLIVTDDLNRQVGEIFYDAARILVSEGRCREAIIVSMVPREVNGQEPPGAVAELMARGNVVMLATSRSLSHTLARKRACSKGARIASMPGITREMIRRTFSIDNELMRAKSRVLAETLTLAKHVRVKTPEGTDISFDISKRKAHGYHEGLFSKKGSWGNLPSGEACIAPVEGTAEGVYVVDLSIAGFGILKRPVYIEVRKGLIHHVRGGKGAGYVIGLLDKFGRSARNIAELGIGTNNAARITGNVLEDEKVSGTAHIAFGDNYSLGGRVKSGVHIDGVFSKPTVIVDNEIIMLDGRLSESIIKRVKSLVKHH